MGQYLSRDHDGNSSEYASCPRYKQYLAIPAANSSNLTVTPVAPTHASLFAAHASQVMSSSSITAPTVLYGCYRHELTWYVCRIRSHDCDGTYTVVWEDGTLQMGTRVLSELRRPADPETVTELEGRVRAARVMYSSSQNSESTAQMHTHASDVTSNDDGGKHQEVPTHNRMNVWEAAKKGDMKTVLHLIDFHGVSPNAVESLGRQSGPVQTTGNDNKATSQQQQQLQGRTPLYWACFVGHVELVREILTRGGVDADGSAYLCITTNERADDNRDLMFDPDTGTYSDWVDYNSTTNSNNNNSRADGVALIRAMLLAAKAAHSSTRCDADTIRRLLPQRLYQSTVVSIPHRALTLEETESLVPSFTMEQAAAGEWSPTSVKASSECVVCLANPANAIPVPCGHIACCHTCLKKIRQTRDGCPICRARIVTIVLH